MKKIMKKVMSLALVVMMVASLLPMTVFADAGVTTVVDSKEYTAENNYTADLTEISTGWSWTRITVTIESASAGWDITFGTVGVGEKKYSSSSGDATTQTYDVATLSDAYVQIYVGEANGTVVYSVTTETIEEPAEGSEVNPYAINDDREITIDGNATAYFKSEPYSNGSYRVVVTGEETADYSLCVPNRWGQIEAIPAVDGVIKTSIFEIDTEYNPSYSYQIVNEGTEPITLSFELLDVYGTYSFPDAAVLGENSASVDSAYQGGYYYLWVAPEAGTLTVTMDEENETGWQYAIGYNSAKNNVDNADANSEETTVAAGEVVQIMVGTFDSNDPWTLPEGTVNWTLGFVATDGVADSKGHMGDSPANTEITTTEWTRIKVTIETFTAGWSFNFNQGMSSVSYSSVEEDALTQTYDVAPNQTVYVQVYAAEGETVTYKITTETIAAPPVGSELNPVVVGSTTTQTIPAGETMYFTSKPAVLGEYVLNIIGEENDAYRFYVAGSGQWWDPGVDVAAVDGEVNVYFSEDAYNYSIINSSNEDIILTFKHEVATGTMNSPATPVIGENAAVIVEGQNAYYYEWTATQDGTVTVTMDTENNAMGWSYVVSNYDANIYGDRYTCDDEIITDTSSVAVSAGDVVTIEMNTYNVQDPYTQYAGTVNWTLAFSTEGGSAVNPPAPQPEVGTEDAPNSTLSTNGTPSTITVKPGTTYYFSVLAAVGEYNLTVAGTAGFEISYYEGVNPNPVEVEDVNGVGKVVLASSRDNYQMISFMITNNTQLSQNYIVALAPATTEGGEGGSTNAPDGTYEKPFVITELGKYTADCGYDNLYYKWTATEDGVLTITISEEDANSFKKVYAYDLNGEPLDRGTDNTKNVTEVKKGDVVMIYTYSSTTVDFNVAFEAGVEKEEEKPATKPESNAGADSYTALTSGTVTLMDSVVTTIFEFTPDKEGIYTITAPSGVLVENWGTSFFPNNSTENPTNTLVVECTSVGQSCLVGFTAAEGTSTIAVSITYKEAEQKEEVEWTVYENTATLEKFETVLKDLEYVDVEDETIDRAVLGKDGFYHLNAANGPILYVDLDDELMSLYGAADLGKVVEYITEDGEIVAKISYSEAVLEYYKVANKDGLYPLTADLITIYKNAGAYAGWYEEDGFPGFTADDAWMFACYYVPGSEDKEADNTVVAPLPAPEEGKDLVVDKEDLDEYIEQAVQSGAPLELPTTNENVTMTFDPNELAENDEIALNLTVNVVDDAKDETVAKNDKITDKNFVLKVEFSHEGKLPAEAVISIQLPAAIAEKYEKLFYYQIMADGSLKFVCDAPVVDGVAKVTQDHCSDYVLLTEKLVDVPGTGDSTNVGLWFAVLALGVAAIAGSVVMRKKEF